MSLEETIAANTVAVNALTKALLAGGTKSGAPAVAAPKTSAPVGKPAVAKPGAKPAAKAVPADDGALSYETDVKPKILELGAIPGTGRAAVSAIMKQFGVTKGPELDEGQYEEALALLNEKIEELGEQA